MFEKTDFTATNKNERTTEIYNWLSENGTDYFESVEVDYSHDYMVTCNITGGTTFKISDTYYAMIKLANGNQYNNKSYNVDENEQLKNAFKYGIKTENGIFIANDFKNDKNICASCLISKTADGITFMDLITYAENKFYHDFILPSYDKVISGATAFEGDKLSLCSIVFGDKFTENVFYTPFTPCVDFVGKIIDADGQHYFYDGLCALKYEE